MGGSRALTGHLALVHSGDPRPTREGVTCPICTDFFGFAFKPMVTIEPVRAYRAGGGYIVTFRQQIVLCWQCQERGVRTVLGLGPHIEARGMPGMPGETERGNAAVPMAKD